MLRRALFSQLPLCSYAAGGFEMKFNGLFQGVVTGVIVSLSLAAISARSQAATVSDEAPVRQVMRQLVDYYIAEGRLRYNHKINLDFIIDDAVNASANYDGRKVWLELNTGTLEAMTADQSLIIVCHELGHALGDLPHGNFEPDNGGMRNPLSLEGEADYFAGKCAVDYYMNVEGLDYNGAQEKTFFAAFEMFGNLYETTIDTKKAARSTFNGVNLDYPDPNCRTLAVWAGAEGKARPKCWYNP